MDLSICTPTNIFTVNGGVVIPQSFFSKKGGGGGGGILLYLYIHFLSGLIKLHIT